MIIVNSGFWFGLFDKRDAFHLVRRDFLVNCHEPMITTYPVLTEALHLLMNRGHVQQGLRILTLLSDLKAQRSVMRHFGNTLRADSLRSPFCLDVIFLPE